ncbi:hypothetical protein KQH49_00505, partial [Mycetohabitans sp. B5]
MAERRLPRGCSCSLAYHRVIVPIVVRLVAARQQSLARSGAGEYGYIIVGAGTPCCVLANRFSVDPGIRAGGRADDP